MRTGKTLADAQAVFAGCKDHFIGFVVRSSYDVNRFSHDGAQINFTYNICTYNKQEISAVLKIIEWNLRNAPNKNMASILKIQYQKYI